MASKENTVSASDRFAPCLRTRLIDEEPEKKTENYSRGITLKMLRQEILSNIKVILNSKSHVNTQELNHDPELIDSVLGMGLPDFCGCAQDDKEKEKLRLQLIHQLKVFEPRLNPETIQVNYVSENNVHSLPGTLQFEIHAQIHVAPLTEEFVFRSTLDLEAGNATISTGEGII